AGGDMIRGLRQRLAPGVAAQRRKALRKALLQADLHRVITGQHAVFHPLDISKCRIRPGPCGLRSVRIDDYRLLVQVAEPAHLGSLVANISEIPEQVLNKLVPNPKDEYLNLVTR